MLSVTVATIRAAISETVAAAGKVANQYRNYEIEKKAQAKNSDSKFASDTSKTPRSSNGKLTSECESFADYVDVKSIAVSGISAAVFALIAICVNGVVNSAFAGGLETGFVNRTAQVIANFAMGGNVSILQFIKNNPQKLPLYKP